VTGLVIFGNQFVLLARWVWAAVLSRFRTPAPVRG
jgi:hypothetical protein